MEKIEMEMKVFTATYSEKHVLLIGDFYVHLMLETCSLILVTVISKKKTIFRILCVGVIYYVQSIVWLR